MHDFQPRAPPNNPINERAPSLVPSFHSFWKQAMELWKENSKINAFSYQMCYSHSSVYCIWILTFVHHLSTLDHLEGKVHQSVIKAVKWRSGESTRLPPMWPGFNSRTRQHTYGLSLLLVLDLAPSVFLRVLRFHSLYKQTTFLNSNSIGNPRTTGLLIANTEYWILKAGKPSVLTQTRIP